MERPVLTMLNPPAAGESTGPNRRWLSRSEWEDVLDVARQMALAYLGDLHEAASEYITERAAPARTIFLACEL